MNDIAAAGNWIVDQIKIINTWPKIGNLSDILEEKKCIGGAPANVLINLAKLDHSLKLEGIGLVGNDSNGKYILEQLKHYNIKNYLTITDKLPTSYTDVLTLKNTGERTFFHYRGANKLLNFETFNFETISSKIIHIGYLLLLDSLDAKDDEYGTVMAKLLCTLQKKGIETSIDVVSEESNRFKKIVTPSLKYVDYLILNEIEAGKIANYIIRKNRTIDVDNLKKSALFLLNKGVRKLVVIHMPEGALLVTKKEMFYQSSHLLPKDFIKGTTGAGDAFCAGMLYGLYKNWKLGKSLKLAVANACLCLSDPTTTEGIKSLEETLNFAENMPYQPSLL